MKMRFSIQLVWVVALYGLLSNSGAMAQTLLPTDSLAQVAPPRLGFRLAAGAFAGTLGYGSFVEPRVTYRVAPRWQLSSSVTMTQMWGNHAFNSSARAEGTSTAFMGAPDRQFLLHLGGAYALTDKLTLTGCVWKELNQTAMPYRAYRTPYGFGQSPREGFQFQAHYQVSPNITVSGGVRSGAAYGGSFYGQPMGGFYGPGGY